MISRMNSRKLCSTEAADISQTPSASSYNFPYARTVNAAMIRISGEMPSFPVHRVHKYRYPSYSGSFSSWKNDARHSDLSLEVGIIIHCEGQEVLSNRLILATPDHPSFVGYTSPCRIVVFSVVVHCVSDHQRYRVVDFVATKAV